MSFTCLNCVLIRLFSVFFLSFTGLVPVFLHVLALYAFLQSEPYSLSPPYHVRHVGASGSMQKPIGRNVWAAMSPAPSSVWWKKKTIQSLAVVTSMPWHSPTLCLASYAVIVSHSVSLAAIRCHWQPFGVNCGHPGAAPACSGAAPACPGAAQHSVWCLAHSSFGYLGFFCPHCICHVAEQNDKDPPLMHPCDVSV